MLASKARSAAPCPGRIGAATMKAHSGVMAICANQNCSAKSIKRSLPQYTFPKYKPGA